MKHIGLFFIALAVLAACSPYEATMRKDTARRIAEPAFMYPREINTQNFNLLAYERVHQKGTTANLYIEGDGMVWFGHEEPQMDPTPKNPVALHLASRDSAENVVYLGRPCQYTGVHEQKACNGLVWTKGRYSENVIRNMSEALDDMKRRHGITGFHAIGYQGGGAIVSLLAAKRDDIHTIRTVAGILDHNAWTHMKDKDPYENSLNPVNIALDIADIPQHHFIGAQDYSVTPDIYWRFYQASGRSPCLKSSIVADADHNSGWVHVWPNLLKEPVNCKPTLQKQTF